MEFNSQNAIYLQIAGYVCDQIQLGKWPTDEKIPSVRELAVSMEVNPNTVMRSYEHLQQQGVIYLKRGLGNYVSPTARQAIADSRKKQFVEEELPAVFAKMALYQITPADIQTWFEHYTSTLTSSRP